MRTYTPRRYNALTNTLEVQFILHGEGVASRWAEQAAPAHRAAIGRPSGRFVLDSAARRWWIGGDESAIPAVAALVEALPSTAEAQVHPEVDSPDDHVDLPYHPSLKVIWHDRLHTDRSRWGGKLVDAIYENGIDSHSYVWVGCEASAVRRIRAYLLTERTLPPTQLTTRGYWRGGEANHPDHDYGED